MSHYTTYELDEFQPWPGLAVYVYGNAEISYNWQGRDRDTGEGAGPYDIELHYLEIHGDKNGETHKIDKAHPLFKAIEAALIENPHVWDACRDDYES